MASAILGVHPYQTIFQKKSITFIYTYTGKLDERSLCQSIVLITGGITPLTIDDEKQSPDIGDDMDFVFVDASCSAEAVARLPKNRQLMCQGKLYI